jgi:hypothetical protein
LCSVQENRFSELKSPFLGLLSCTIENIQNSVGNAFFILQKKLKKQNTGKI